MITGDDYKNRMITAARNESREVAARLREAGYRVIGVRFDRASGYVACVDGIDGWHNIADLLERAGGAA